jgi:hypothetical protein
LGTGTKRVLAGTGEKEPIRYIKYLRGEPGDNGRQPIYDTIAYDKWVRRTTAADAADRVSQQVLKRFGNIQLAVAFGVDDNSPTGFGVEIEYIIRRHANGKTTEPEVSVDRLRREFEGTQKGIAENGSKRAIRREIPVRVIKRTERDIASCPEPGEKMDEYTLDSIPGGVDTSVGTDAPYSLGSIAAPFNDGTFGEGLISSGHLAAEGDPVRQGAPLTQEKIGTVKHSRDDPGIDFCFIKTKDGKSGKPRVADPADMRNTDYPIGGIVTRQTLKNNVGTNELYYSQEKNSKRNSGTIIKLRSGIVIPGYTQVVTTNNVVDGDSGGLLFGVDDNDAYAYVAGELQREEDADNDNCADEAVSTIATTIENKRNGFFRSV